MKLRNFQQTGLAMAQPHIPDLAAIEALSDREIRFYAVLGTVVSLTAGLEISFVRIFALGLRIDEETAGQILFKARAGSLQRDMAITAMSARLKGDQLRPAWEQLSRRIVDATSQNSPRHLLAHICQNPECGRKEHFSSESEEPPYTD